MIFQVACLRTVANPTVSTKSFDLYVAFFFNFCWCILNSFFFFRLFLLAFLKQVWKLSFHRFTKPRFTPNNWLFVCATEFFWNLRDINIFFQLVQITAAQNLYLFLCFRMHEVTDNIPRKFELPIRIDKIHLVNSLWECIPFKCNNLFYRFFKFIGLKYPHSLHIE